MGKMSLASRSFPEPYISYPPKGKGLEGTGSCAGPGRIGVGLPRDVHRDLPLCLSLSPRLRQRQRGGGHFPTVLFITLIQKWGQEER